MRRQVPIREVNQHLSRYIEIAERGEEIIITRRGKPVARLSAVEHGRGLSEEQQKELLDHAEQLLVNETPARCRKSSLVSWRVDLLQRLFNRLDPMLLRISQCSCEFLHGSNRSFSQIVRDLESQP